MNYILGVLFILILIFLINNYLKKNALKKLKKQLTENWGLKTKKEHFNFFVISKYFNNNSHKEKAYHILSEKSNLDFDIDAVFKFIDRTSSKIGQQYLYFKLRTIGSKKDLLKFDELTSVFEKDKELSISCQLELIKLNNNNSYYLEE
ncbi:MAG: DNA mismatch repair protein MutS, partial [Polaribacter sp.]|nr:DNA mismatch repair protein MutS [Polaribacter sp.]